MKSRKLLLPAAILTVIAAAVSIFIKISFAAPVSCPCSIWPASTTPANASVNNSTAVEVGVKFKADTAGYITGVRFYKASNNTGTHIGNLWKADGTLLARATFSGETGRGWQQVKFATPVQITPGANYVASYFAPRGNYSYNSNYFASRGTDSGVLHALGNSVAGGNGLYRYTGSSAFPNTSYASTNYWVDVVFETKVATPRAPILLVTSSDYRFSSYYAEILKNEGYSFETAGINDVTPTLLSQYDVVVLGQIPLSSTQASTFINWVSGGGNLIAMRPDKKLAPLAGLTATTSTLSNQYLKINTASGPGVGLTNQTIQFHDTADYYTLSGATEVAELYSSASTATGKPAVSLRSVGSSGGQVAVFTYDLAKSVVLTRQGNPDWAGQNRETVDGVTRSDDLFYGNAVYDRQTDWVNLTKAAIPQADEQQRLLGNLITQMDSDKKPIPHLWYLPNGKKAAVVMTADDHATSDAGGQVITRFNRYLQLDNQYNPGCNVAKWECIRASNYFFMNSPMSLAQAKYYSALGFDLGVHIRTSNAPLQNGLPSNMACDSYTPASIDTRLVQQMGTFASRYPGVPAQATNRTHCIVWSDYASQPKAEANRGIRMDTNYYYWPGSWVKDRPGMMNGSGFPMRFADQYGNTIDTFQAMTQMQDEGPEFQSYPYTVNTLLDNALGATGYYGVFTANMHTDNTINNSGYKSDLIVASAKARGIPVVSARQILNWIDGRNDSRIVNMSWSGSNLTFGVSVAGGAKNLLHTVLPMNSKGGRLRTITTGGSAVPFTVETIKGIEYANFPVNNSGTYVATYMVDVTGPAITTVSPTHGNITANPNGQIKATFNEAIRPTTVNGSTFLLRDTNGTSVAATVSYDSTAKTAILKPSKPLTVGVAYIATIRGGGSGVKDTAGNPLAADKAWSFKISATLSLWSASTAPAVVDSTDVKAVEVGVRFTSDINGYINGIRFYKGAKNTGVHTGTLWTASGSKLATVTFSGETASGWQQAFFSTPVAIKAGTAYIASYHAPSGHYSDNVKYFLTAARNSGTLHAPKSYASALNGVYTYGASAFPSSSWNATNYWVDVIFHTSP